MIKTKIVSAVAIVALALTAGVASAQTANTVTVSSTPVTSSPSAGSTGVTLGTFMLTGTNGAAYSVTSIPVTLSTASGGQPTDLSACQIWNSNNAPLNTGNNQVNALVNGTNTITFDQPLSVTGTSVTLTLHCNVASTAVSGSTYQFTAGTPVFTSTSTTGTSTLLGVSLTTVPSVNTGVQNAVLALLTLDASQSNQNVNVTSIPISLTFSGADPSNYSNCSLRSASSLTTALNNGNNAITATANGTMSFTLDTPLSIPAGSADILALTCSISPSAAAGSSIAISMNPGSVIANGASTGPFTPVVSTNNGSPVPTSGTVEITMPTTTTVTPPVTTTVPGAPNTGAGGNSTSNMIAIAASLLVALGGAAFILKRQTR